MQQQAGISEWTLDRHCSVDIITTLTLRGTTSTVGLSAHSLAHHWCNCRPQSRPQAPNALHDGSTPGNVRQREPRTVCTASDINQMQTPPLRYVSSARARHAFMHDILRYMAATISYTRRIRD